PVLYPPRGRTANSFRRPAGRGATSLATLRPAPPRQPQRSRQPTLLRNLCLPHLLPADQRAAQTLALHLPSGTAACALSNPAASRSRDDSVKSDTTILIVDDDDVLAQVLGRVLTQQGYRVVRASDAGQALQLVQQQTPQLALVDLCLPDQNGLEL